MAHKLKSLRMKRSVENCHFLARFLLNQYVEQVFRSQMCNEVTVRWAKSRSLTSRHVCNVLAKLGIVHSRDGLFSLPSLSVDLPWNETAFQISMTARVM